MASAIERYQANILGESVDRDFLEAYRPAEEMGADRTPYDYLREGLDIVFVGLNPCLLTRLWWTTVSGRRLTCRRYPFGKFRLIRPVGAPPLQLRIPAAGYAPGEHRLQFSLGKVQIDIDLTHGRESLLLWAHSQNDSTYLT